MSSMDQLTPDGVKELVLADQVIRSAVYKADQAGRRWGDDLIPALMDLFRVERDTRENHHSNSWAGFARHWQGEIFRLEFYLVPGSDTTDQILVVTGIEGSTPNEDELILVDNVFGEIKVPELIPPEKEWKKRISTYQSIRRDSDPEGSAAVDAFIHSLTGWQKERAIEIDQLIRQEIPNIQCAVKWHVPFYGVKDNGYFVQFSVFSKKLKFTFLRGTSLEPEPPVVIRNQAGRSMELKKKDKLDRDQFVSWLHQAAKLPGMFT